MKYVVNCRQYHNGFSTRRAGLRGLGRKICGRQSHRSVDARLCCQWPCAAGLCPCRESPSGLILCAGIALPVDHRLLLPCPPRLPRPTGQGWHIGKVVWERLPFTGVLIAGGCHHAARTRFACPCRAIGSRAARFLQGATATFGAFRSNLPQDAF